MKIVDSHHRVLEAWASVRTRLGQAPRVLTFDHHTDTSLAFRNFFRKTGVAKDQQEALRQQWLSQVEPRRASSVQHLIDRVSNDEHISAAIGAGLISSALVVAHRAQNTDLSTYERHRIICQAVDADSGRAKLTREDCDRCLESDFVLPRLERMNEVLRAAGEPGLFEGPFILDFDLDYFNTWASVQPKDPSLIRRLAKDAVFITIATEPEYVQHCRMDGDIESERLLSLLLKTLDHVGDPSAIVS